MPNSMQNVSFNFFFFKIHTSDSENDANENFYFLCVYNNYCLIVIIEKVIVTTESVIYDDGINKTLMKRSENNYSGTQDNVKNL